MADYDYSNPFAGVLTPDVLYGQREADIQRRYDPAGFWVGEAARAGSKLRKQLNAKGIPMGAEDEQAMNNQAMMEELQKDIAKRVEAGELSVEDAQTEAVKQAMQGFMASGDYQSAASLKPALDAIEKQELERQKLRGEYFRDQAAGTKSLTEAAGTASKLPWQLEEIQSKIALNNAKASAEGGKGKGKGGGDALAAWINKETDVEPAWEKYYPKSEMGKMQAQVDASSRVFDRLGNIAELVRNNPGLGSNTAGMITAISDEIVGATNTAQTMLSLQTPEDAKESESVAARRKKEIVAAADAKARQMGLTGDSLNEARGMLESKLMDLAYTLAKARDPGGRLSDADVNNALKIIGAAGDPKRMQKVMRELAEDTYKDSKIRIKNDPFLGTATRTRGSRETFEESYQRYLALVSGIGRPMAQSPKPAPGPAAPAAAAPSAPYTFQMADGSGTGTIKVITGPRK